MRKRSDIEKDYKQTQELILEILLDIRELIVKAQKTKKVKRKVQDASNKRSSNSSSSK